MFKELRKLKKLIGASESELKDCGYTREILEKRLAQEKLKVKKELNYAGWCIVILFVFPLALMQLGMTMRSAAITSWFAIGFVLWVLD